MIEPLPEKEPSKPTPAPVAQTSKLSDQYDSEVLDYINDCLDEGVATETIAKKLAEHDFSASEVRRLVAEVAAGRNRLSDRYDAEVLDFVHDCLDKGQSTHDIVQSLAEHDFTASESRELVAELIATRLRRDGAGRLRSPGRGSSRKHQGDADLTPVDWCLAILCSGIGCIIGIVRLIQGRENGLKMLVVSLVFSILSILVYRGLVDFGVMMMSGR